MNFILVPFLLAGQIGTNEENWKNGPEYTFGVRASMATHMKDNNGRFMGTSLHCKLKCQPNEPDGLVCRFEDAKFTRLSPRTMDPEEMAPPENATYSDFGFGHASFEIKFDDKGITNYLIASDDLLVSDSLMKMYRAIANQLSIGAKLDKNVSLKTRENFTIGDCSVTYKVSRKPFVNATRGKFQLVSLADLDINDDEIVEIVKIRHLDDCLSQPSSFFGTRYTYGLVYRGTPEELITSASRMLILKSNFTSETVNIVGLYGENGKEIGFTFDHIQLTLESIDPAQSKFSPISNPVSVSVLVKAESQKVSV